SRFHRDRPYLFEANGASYRVHYAAGESETPIFGGNSNWRGPVWFPVNFLFAEALERFGYFYGDECKIECPTGSDRQLTFQESASEIFRRLTSLFLIDKNGRRPCFGTARRYADDPYLRDPLLVHEQFNSDTGRGRGAST